jgi:hypothetical protein
MIWGATNAPDEPDFFYFDLIRKYVVTFGRMFSDIIIQRSVANNVITNIKVPLQYAAKDKQLVALEGDPNLDRPDSVLLPIMTFELAPPGIQYDASRKLQTLSKNVVRYSANTNQFMVQYVPVPFNIFFNLYIYVKNQNDGTQILEQILPFFTPDFTPQIELIPSMNEVRDIPIEMIGQMGYQDLYDEKFTVSRLILYTLSFRMRALFYGPIRDKPMIKFATLNLRAGISTNNQCTVNYSNASGNLGSIQPNTSVFTYYANNLLMGSGTINKVALHSNTSGTLQIGVLTGNLNNTIHVSTNTATLTLTTANGFSYGIYDREGRFTPTPLVAEAEVIQVTETANGQPTSNVNNSISWTLIDINDDFGWGSYMSNTFIT